jgi:drug/metabolite transporter (DMT)-like permease
VGGRRRQIATGTVFVLVWSSGYLAGTIGTRAVPTLALVAWRFLVALVLLSIFAVATGTPWPRRPRTYAHLAVTGVLLQALQLAAVYLGLTRGVPAGLSALILSAAPLLVSAAAVPLFAERLTGTQWLGSVLGLAGVGVSLSSRLSGGPAAAGYLFTVVALLGLTGGTLYQKRYGGQVDLRAGITVQLAGATAAAFPLAALHGGLHLPLTGTVFGVLAWTSLVNSIGAFVLLFGMLRTRSGSAATSLLYLVPPVTAVLAWPILGQPLHPLVFLGMAVAGVGVLLVNRVNRAAAGSAAAPASTPRSRSSSDPAAGTRPAAAPGPRSSGRTT